MEEKAHWVTLESPLNSRTRRAHAYRSRRAALLCETTVAVKSPGRCSHRRGRVTLQGAREKGYHLKFYLHFISPLLPHYWCRVAALLSQTSRDHRCGLHYWCKVAALLSQTSRDHRCGLHYWCKVAALLSQTSQNDHRCGRATRRGSREERL